MLVGPAAVFFFTSEATLGLPAFWAVGAAAPDEDEQAVRVRPIAISTAAGPGRTFLRMGNHLSGSWPPGSVPDD
ncbi:hypothetical protein Kisp02_73240 [Kineosporia sp. NBRC 101731]|nr:hypothetical protein Kisp02_73240 [Kineosporia sp. NBRC 101731]